jgi:WhiB family transcriptional regulator, redox-sensing transcriptional regulator
MYKMYEPLVDQRLSELWQEQAACRGPHAAMFFPPHHVERKDDRLSRERRAKAICAGCPVREPCLQYAIAIREPHGIWGGMNEAERRTLLEGEASATA